MSVLLWGDWGSSVLPREEKTSNYYYCYNHLKDEVGVVSWGEINLQDVGAGPSIIL